MTCFWPAFGLLITPCHLLYLCLSSALHFLVLFTSHQRGCDVKSVAATVAVFVIILQLYLVKTQVGPTPPAFQQGNKIALLSHCLL